jgi:hypothetical protein
MPSQGTIAPATQHPCVHCPWRTANQGKPHPLGWYTKANLRRLWARLRRGEDMSCHPTDPRNPVPKGTRPAPEGSTTLECAGSLILKQRELMRFQKLAERHPGKDSFKLYRHAHPLGLTRDGLWAVVDRALFGGVPLIGGLKMTRPDLNEPGISAPDLAAWDPTTDGTDGKPAADPGEQRPA